MQIAAFGENIVIDALKNSGWGIHARNFRHIGFELDIVAQKQGTLTVIEVKTRRFIAPIQQDYSRLLAFKKRRSLERGIYMFLDKNPAISYETIRFDLAVVIFNPTLTHCRPSIDYHVNVFS